MKNSMFLYAICLPFFTCPKNPQGRSNGRVNEPVLRRGALGLQNDHIFDGFSDF